MHEREYAITSEVCGILYRILGISFLWLLWVKTGNGTSGLFYILILIILNLLRWRWKGLRWTLLIDQALCFIFTLHWHQAGYGLSLAIFDGVFLGVPWVLLPALVYPFLYESGYTLGWLMLQSVFAGFALWGWKTQRQNALTRMDSDSKKRYELESLKKDLLTANVQVARMAEISERGRIAREIHDHAGHEIIAAYMSLQTIEGLWQPENPELKEMFAEALERLEGGIDQIRATVHNLAPLSSFGADYLRKYCHEFTACPIDLNIYGDTGKIPVYLWSILEPCTKEALTNILRHAAPTRVSVTLDVTPYIVRLCIENDGVKTSSEPNGIGLRNLRHRAMAVGGTLSTDASDGFRLICVLPLE